MTEPVNAICDTSLCDVRSLPAPLPYPHIILIKPGGTPALSIALAKIEAVAKGVSSAVFTTVELPAAKEQDNDLASIEIG